MIASPQPRYMTADEYLEWESRQEIRHEYCKGEVLAMAGGTKNHDKLAFNLRKELEDTVEEQGCDMTGSDVKIMVKEGRFYRYPDLAVSCDEHDRSNDTFYEFPKLIVEVLSASTEGIDRGEKFQEYIQIPTLREYVLIHPSKMYVEWFRRGEGQMWVYSYYEAGEMVEIESVGVKFSIEKLYRNVRLESAD